MVSLSLGKYRHLFPDTASKELKNVYRVVNIRWTGVVDVCSRWSTSWEVVVVRRFTRAHSPSNTTGKKGFQSLQGKQWHVKLQYAGQCFSYKSYTSSDTQHLWLHAWKQHSQRVRLRFLYGLTPSHKHRNTVSWMLQLLLLLLHTRYQFPKNCLWECPHHETKQNWRVLGPSDRSLKQMYRCRPCYPANPQN